MLPFLYVSHIYYTTTIICYHSLPDDHGEVLTNYLSSVFGALGKVRLVRSNVALGLIRARLTGARLAKAKVIVAMDSHMEVQKGW